jgi:FG-GAP repeat
VAGTLAVVALIGLYLAPAPRAAADPAGSAVSARADVNGDGIPDLIVATSARLQSGVANPPDIGGSVYVVPGGTPLPGTAVNRKPTLIYQDLPIVNGVGESDDNFGFSLATGDFNNDGRADVAIGSPYEDVGSTQDAGRVAILYGTSQPPYFLESRGADEFHQDKPGVPGEVEARDHFGAALATGDFNNDRYADLAIGVPDENIGSTVDAGGLTVVYGGPDGLVADPAGHPAHAAQGIDADSTLGAAVVGDPETGDHFGWSLASGDVTGDGIDDLAFTVEGEQVSGETDPNARGDVLVLKGSASGLSASGVDHVNVLEIGTTSGHLRTVVVGKFRGSAGPADVLVYADQLRGAPANSGALVELRGGADGISPTRIIPPFNQNTAYTGGNVSGADPAEQDDLFGAALAVGKIDGDQFDDVLVGDLGEDERRGAVDLLFGSAQGLLPASDHPDFAFDESNPAIGSTRVNDEAFGAAVRILDVDGDGAAEIIVGAPREGGSLTDGTLWVLDVTRSGATTTIANGRPLTRGNLNPGTCPASIDSSCYGPGYPIAGGTLGPFESPTGPAVATLAG